MNVFNPEDSTHILKIIPRFYPAGIVTVNFKNEESKEVKTYTGTPTITDGYLYFSITDTFTNNQRFQVEIKTPEEVVYRGKIFVTNQADNTQGFKISKDIFTYE